MRCGLPKSAAGTSATLQFIFAKKRRYDPIYAALELPILYWARQAFADDEQSTMQEAWQKQIVRLRAHKRRPWKAVAGPAGALLLSLRQVGWITSSAFNWKTD